MHAWVEIDLDAIRANVVALRARLRPGVGFIAMVKGNAYGHGAVEVARAVLEAGATHLGVAFPSEGRQLRKADLGAPILVLGSFAAEDIPELLTYHLTPSVADTGLARELARAARARGQRVPVHIEVDTGMGRLGVDWHLAAAAIEEIASLDGLIVEGMFTHFSTADEADRTYTKVQMRRFQQVSDAVSKAGIHVPLRHYSNSAGALKFSDTVLDAVRPGITLYGLFPSSDGGQEAVSLTPALALRSRIAQVKRMPAGAFVSYGRTFQLSEARYIATVAVGYADGYPRALSNEAHVLIRGARYPIVGRVTMDHTMVDMGPHDPKLPLGERVTLLGKDGQASITAEELGELSGTINYEITTRISERPVRIFKGKR